MVLSGGLVDVNRYDSSVSQDTFAPTAPAQGHALLAYERPNFFVRGYWNRFTTTGVQAFNPVIAPFLQLSDRNGTSNSLFASDTFNIDVQHTVQPSESHRITYGVSYRHNTVSSNIISEFTRENRLGFVLQDEWTLSKQWTAVAGVRYDMDTFINPAVSPRAALIYSFSQDHRIRASGSVAYRPPTPFDEKVLEFVTSSFPSPAITIQGNRGLAPEQMISYEVEYQGWFLNHRLRLRTDIFFNHMSDLISTRDQSATLATPINDGGSADIYGGEAGIEFLATRWLSGFANYTYQEIGQTLTGRVQRAAPRHKFNFGARAEFENGINGEILFYHYGSAAYPPGQSFTSLASAGLVQLPDPRVRQLQPPEHARRLQVLAAEGRRRLHARR
ncbi:MAG: TonB-dependent receptor [Nitrospira sp.]